MVSFRPRVEAEPPRPPRGPGGFFVAALLSLLLWFILGTSVYGIICLLLH